MAFPSVSTGTTQIGTQLPTSLPLKLSMATYPDTLALALIVLWPLKMFLSGWTSGRWSSDLLSSNWRGLNNV